MYSFDKIVLLEGEIGSEWVLRIGSLQRFSARANMNRSANHIDWLEVT